MRLHVGGGTSRGALTVFPVWGEYDGRRGYSSDPTVLQLAERADGASVPVLMASNGGERPVLLLEGHLLEGGWQNRVLTRSVLVPARSTLEVEVACVEAGRWHGGRRQSLGGRRTSPRVRGAAHQPEQHRQHAVWDRVARYEARYGANDTASFAVHVDRAADDVAALTADLRPLPGQVGVVIGIAGHPVIADVFDSERTLRREFDAIVAAAALDAVGATPEPTPSRRARRFVDRAARLPLQPTGPAGLGTSIAGRDQFVETTALAWRNRLVHRTVINLRHALHAEVGA